MSASMLASIRLRRRSGRPAACVASLARARVLGALVGIGFAASPAWAEPATPQGARDLTDALARFIGRAPFDKGLITITPQGESYGLDADFDSGKLGFPADGPVIRFGPFHLQLTPQDDGTYAMTSAPAPLFFSFASAGKAPAVRLEERLEGCTATGTFDPKLALFSRSTSGCDRQTLTLRTPVEDIDATFGRIAVQTSAAPAADSVDAHMTADLADLVETVTVKNPLRPTPATVIRAGAAHQDFTVKGLAAGKILEIIALLAGKDMAGGIAALQEGMKSKALAALPLWREISGDMVLNDFSMGTPAGIVRAAAVDEKIRSTGLVPQARYSFGIAVSGLSLPDDLVPDWAKSFVPTQGRLDFEIAGFDLEAMARRVIRDFDATKYPPLPGDLHAALAGLFAQGHPRLHFEQELKASGLDVTGRGDTSIVPAQQGTATISASGLDGLIAAINGSSLPNRQRALLSLAFIKGLAKAGPDGRAVWDVEFDSLARRITVNGQTFGPGKPR
ncbi:hypothetical protein [Labrys monachus]|uniref:DUF2125 domain-containing protein n=1 Tax=Labrys monachus TaxID=217067 RepID=A0ABU0FIB9_9HYPH|nr:hypothetical protein [Labrys monachus]MDQ0393869.1 hypothetical protein [Labrys monachus]